MVKRFSIVIFILYILIIVPGCRKSPNSTENKTILFQYEYMNYAWGYQHNGFIVDNLGNILTYNNPQNWNFTDKDLMLTEEQVNENISFCKHTGKKIPESELKKYSGYIKNISSSQVTAIKNVAADAGTSEFICYQFSENTGKYKKCLIKMEGDFTCENLNFYSKKVTLWLKDLKNSIASD